MTKCLFSFLILLLTVLRVAAQDAEAYLRANAVRISNPERLSDSVYRLLSPFQVIMFGEMHGTNESAPFIQGLTKLFTGKGDSVLVGLEIPPAAMVRFTSLGTDSSIYQSAFFSKAPATSGKESLPWASLIARLNRNNKVKIFFFDVADGEGRNASWDSLMAMKAEMQLGRYPGWRMITLGGNYHNRITDPKTMASILKRKITAKVCTLNMEYKEGSANANFGHGLEIKQLESHPSVFNSTEGYDRYVMLKSPTSRYAYDGFYFIKTLSPAKMTTSK